MVRQWLDTCSAAYSRSSKCAKLDFHLNVCRFAVSRHTGSRTSCVVIFGILLGTRGQRVYSRAPLLQRSIHWAGWLFCGTILISYHLDVLFLWTGGVVAGIFVHCSIATLIAVSRRAGSRTSCVCILIFSFALEDRWCIRWHLYYCGVCIGSGGFSWYHLELLLLDLC